VRLEVALEAVGYREEQFLMKVGIEFHVAREL